MDCGQTVFVTFRFGELLRYAPPQYPLPGRGWPSASEVGCGMRAEIYGSLQSSVLPPHPRQLR